MADTCKVSSDLLQALKVLFYLGADGDIQSAEEFYDILFDPIFDGFLLNSRYVARICLSDAAIFVPSSQ